MTTGAIRVSCALLFGIGVVLASGRPASAAQSAPSNAALHLVVPFENTTGEPRGLLAERGISCAPDRRSWGSRDAVDRARGSTPRIRAPAGAVCHQLESRHRHPPRRGRRGRIRCRRPVRAGGRGSDGAGADHSPRYRTHLGGARRERTTQQHAERLRPARSPYRSRIRGFARTIGCCVATAAGVRTVHQGTDC